MHSTWKTETVPHDSDAERRGFIQNYVMARIQHSAAGIRRICDDADYTWDRIANPRPLPQAQVTPIKKGVV